MKLAVLADIHLETKFAGLGTEAASLRRENIKKSLQRAAELSVDEGASALLLVGDVYEQDRFVPDTGRFLARLFESLEPMPVLIAPGNHDWWGPESLYALVPWSPNVHIFTGSELEPFDLEDGLTVWGAAHQAPRTEQNFLERFEAPKSGLHIAAIHGSESSRLSDERLSDPAKFAHAPFEESDIERAGLLHLFAGHYHTPSSSSLCTYPGNPDPLTFGEDRDRRPRGLVFATVEPSGAISIEEPRDVSHSRVFSVEVDVGGTNDKRELIDAVAEEVHRVTQSRPDDAFLRISLYGEVDPGVDLYSLDALITAELKQAAAVIVDASRVGHFIDIEELRAEQSIRGEFVRSVLAAEDLEDRLKERIISTGLAVLEGREDRV